MVFLVKKPFFASYADSNHYGSVLVMEVFSIIGGRLPCKHAEVDAQVDESWEPALRIELVKTMKAIRQNRRSLHAFLGNF